MVRWRVLVALAFGSVAVQCAEGATVDAVPQGGGSGASGASGAAGLDGGPTGGAAGGAGVSSGGQSGSDGGNSCAGVACTTPPANECAGADLKVYAEVGTCDAGSCSYGSQTETCPGGCSAGACTGDPCIGVSCNTPPPPTCSSSSTLAVSQAPGTCTGGTCHYAVSQVNCASGCSAGQCAGDPCAGVTCNTPAANYCTNSTHLTVRDLPGQCDASTGQCSYTTHQEFCAFGCVNGACSGDPCVGVVCPPKANFCVDANTLVQHDSGQCVSGLPCNYGSTNIPCAGGCINGQCVACTTSAQCGAGTWCNNYQCVPCNTDQQCGASCVACGGATPKCSGNSCVECTSNAQCASGQVCTANTCITPVGCTPPSTACTTAGSQDGGCTNSYRIPRTTAGSVSGFTVNNTYGLCNRANNFTGGCAGTGSDAEYRLFMRQAETVDVTLTRGSSTCTIGWSGTVSLKIYQAAPCSSDCTSCPLTCNTIAYCLQSNNQNTAFVAPSDGWYTIVVDSQGPVEDKGGVFYLNVKLSCAGGNCACQ
ncbi:MAG: hypothetical protein KF718_02820 [Polyangiaceae bacterium]|nr:hypothetical protein [Polyangiaceae bacterium]